MQTADITMHDVTSIKLLSKHINNANCREIIIESERGNITITMFGDTEDAENLPLHPEFHNFTREA